MLVSLYVSLFIFINLILCKSINYNLVQLPPPHQNSIRSNPMKYKKSLSLILKGFFIWLFVDAIRHGLTTFLLSVG